MSARPVKIAPWIDAQPIEQHVARVKLPRARSDPWKYTSLNQVLQRLKQPLDGTSSLPITIGDNVLIGDLSSPAIAPWAQEYIGDFTPHHQDLLIALNLLRAQHGYGVVSTHTSKTNVPEVMIDGSESCERILIVVRENANLEIVEYTEGGNRVVECIVLAGANLRHRRIQPPTDSVEYNSLTVKVKDKSSYKLMQYSVGAQLRRNDIVVNIEGEQAQVEVLGGWKLAQTSHLDTQLTVNHLARGSTSQQRFHGVVGDAARAVFNGRILIARNAPKTAAHLQNKNIAISDAAAIYTKPELEIYADDVACAHGATTGQLDEKQIFYLKSRGIPDAQSRDLILDGFLAEVVEHEDGAQLLGIDHYQRVR